MAPTLSAKHTALQLFQQQISPKLPTDTQTPVNLAAIANGVPDASAPSGSKPTKQAQALVAKAMFDDQPNILKMKLDLFDRTGKALGVDKTEFATDSEFYRAIRDAFIDIKRKPDAPAIIAALEKDLGLDDLGISVETVIKAMTDPSSADDDELKAALEKKLAEEDEQLAQDVGTLIVSPDEIGIYSLAAG